MPEPGRAVRSRDVSTVGNIVDLLELVKARVAELARELEEGRAFECQS